MLNIVDGNNNQKLGKYSVKDVFKDKEYFINQLQELNERIDNFKTVFESGKVLNVSYYYRDISNFLLKKIKILQTLGEDQEKIKKFVEEYCEAVKKATTKLTRNDVRDVLSLAYLYKLNREKIEFVEKNMLEDKYIDAPLEMLMNGIFLNKPITTKDFCFKLSLSGAIKKTNDEFMNIVNAENQEKKILHL